MGGFHLDLLSPPPHPWLLGPWATQIVSHGLWCKTYTLEQGRIGEYFPTDSPHGGIPLWSIQVYTHHHPHWMSHDSIFSTPIWMKFTVWLRSKATSLWLLSGAPTWGPLWSIRPLTHQYLLIVTRLSFFTPIQMKFTIGLKSTKIGLLKPLNLRSRAMD